MSWRVQSILAVVFDGPPAHAQASPPSVIDTFRTLLGTDPTAVNNQQGSLQATGAYSPGQVTISAQPNRTDITLSAVENNGGAMPSFDGAVGPPTFERYEPALAALKSLTKKLIADRNVARVAIVVSLLEVHADLRGANRAFMENTGLQVPDSALDLSYALNVRRSYGQAGLEMNRLLRCSTGTIFFIQFGVTPMAMSVPQPQISKYTTELAIDVNTVPRNIPMGPAQALEAVDALGDELSLLIPNGFKALADA